MTVFHYALKPTGFLMLGHAETIGHARATSSRSTDKKHRIYTKKHVDARPADGLPGRVPPRVRRPRARARRSRRARRRPLDAARGEPRAPRALRAARRGRRRRPARSSSSAARPAASSSPRPATPSLNLLKMAREGLLTGCARRSHEARKRSAPVRQDGPARHGERRLARRSTSRSCRSPAGDDAALPGALRRERASAGAAPRAAGKRAPARASRREASTSDASQQLAAGARGEPRVPAVDHPGARGRQRGAAVGQRGDPVEQRGAAEHQRGARHRQGGAAVDQRGAEHGQRGAARPQRGAQPRQQRPGQPARQRADRDRDRGERPAHPALHADGRAHPEPDRRPTSAGRSATSSRTSTAPTSSS